MRERRIKIKTSDGMAFVRPAQLVTVYDRPVVLINEVAVHSNVVLEDGTFFMCAATATEINKLLEPG